MRRGLQFGGIGCAALVALILLVALVGALGHGGSTASPTAVVHAATAVPSLSPTALPSPTVPPSPMAVPSPTLLPSPTAMPATPTPAPSAGAVGQQVVAGGVALTVNQVTRQAQLSAPGGIAITPEKPGEEFVIADVTIENVGRDQTPYNPLYFKVKDPQGYEYAPEILTDPHALKAGELARGEKARGLVAFAVPKGQTGLTLSYQPLVIGGDYPVIRVALP